MRVLGSSKLQITLRGKTADGVGGLGILFFAAVAEQGSAQDKSWKAVGGAVLLQRREMCKRHIRAEEGGGLTLHKRQDLFRRWLHCTLSKICCIYCQKI